MKIALYFHAGSKNHGCEALVYSTVTMFFGEEIKLYSIRREEDEKYELHKFCPISTSWLSRKKFIPWLFLSILGKIRLISENAKRFYYVIHMKEDIALSIGGDNYCYKGQPEQLSYINRKLKEKNKKTVLWGCSVEPELLQDPLILEDLKRYDLITVRESLTRQAMEKAGLTNVMQFADPAFTLGMVKLPLPSGFTEENMIGINVSPLILKYEKIAGQTLKNYQRLIDYILSQTEYCIALIPHVIGNGNDDREIFKLLKAPYWDNDRIIMIEDGNCMILKGYISRCRMFIGARTHAAIAAYSTGVPAVVAGYSVKAKGIAGDLFGTDENYVLPVQKLEDEFRLTKSFQWLEKNEDQIRERLMSKMPEYIRSAELAGEEIKKWKTRKKSN